jgi:hypothetical protein
MVDADSTAIPNAVPRGSGSSPGITASEHDAPASGLAAPAGVIRRTVLLSVSGLRDLKRLRRAPYMDRWFQSSSHAWNISTVQRKNDQSWS